MDKKKYLDICERSNTGRKVSKDDWDLDYVIDGVRELVDEYNFSWDKNILVPNDAQLLDQIFEAGRKLICKTGIYNLTTSRIISLSKDEIEEGLRQMKTELVMGQGKDAITLYARKIEDERAPVIWAGNPGCPTPEEIFYENVLSSAKEPIIDLLTCGSLIDVDGFKVIGNHPTEVLATCRELEYLHKALRQVGRPGMGMLAAESAVTEVGDLSAASQSRLRPCDAHLVAMFNELIIDNGNMIRAAYSLDYGMKNASLACTMVGGLGGDAPGATIVMIASILAANLVCLADYHLCHPIHIRDVATTARGCLWLQSVLCQTFAKNAPAIIVCDLWPKSGAMTKEILYEVAANAIVVTVSGGHLEGVGSADGRVPNGTGLEARFMGEVGKAATNQRMTREEANSMVLKLLDKYEQVFDESEKYVGKRFDQAYDMLTVTPLPEWEKMYLEVKEELRGMGLKI